MKHINELASILNKHLNWNKARIDCLAQMVRGIIAVKTVNLTQISASFTTKAQIPSSYRRIQRFFSSYEFTLSLIVHFITSVFPLPRKFILIMDRTNWKLGTIHINLLVLSIAFRGISLPIFWVNLHKPGTSNTTERIFALAKVINQLGKHRIQCFVADREFVGSEWLKWLTDQQIDFAIRVKENFLVRTDGTEGFTTNITSLFRRLKEKKRKYLKQKYWLKDIPIYLSASRSPKGELLVVASRKYSRESLGMYKKRWEIENMFGCMKSRGFNLEETHLTDQNRLEKLLFVLVIAFCWSYRLGMENQAVKEIPVKKHKRRAQSLFRYGYDELRKAVLNGGKTLTRICHLLKPVSFIKLGGYMHV